MCLLTDLSSPDDPSVELVPALQDLQRATNSAIDKNNIGTLAHRVSRDARIDDEYDAASVFRKVGGKGATRLGGDLL